MIGSRSPSASSCSRANSASADAWSPWRTRAAVACSQETVSAKAAPSLLGEHVVDEAFEELDVGGVHGPRR